MFELSQETIAEARRAVEPLAERLHVAEVMAPFAACRWDGIARGLPTLHLDDTSGIPFLTDIAGVEEYQHRARLRARDGDLFAAVTPATDGYERYCRRHLDLGEVELVQAEPVEGLSGVARACGTGDTYRRLVERARQAGGLAIHPYMGIEPVWELAARLADSAAVPISVIAPPPPVTWIANDKGAFSEAVERVLGAEWLVETFADHDVETLARHLLALAERHPQVAIKRLRCASAMGNAVFDSSRILAAGEAGVSAEVGSFLERTEWDGAEEVLAVAWEQTDLSPSTQLWIPPLEVGVPQLEGVYEQILEGEKKVFVGSRPSGLPPAVDEALGRASLAVAAGLQALGYVGRCSFDFVVVDEGDGPPRLLFTECNGRWGGTSTPMSLLNRLTGGERPPHRAQDFIHRDLVGASFDDILARTGDELFDPSTGRGRYVFYNTGPLRGHGKLDVIALGRTQAEAEAAMEEDLPRLLGL